MAARIAFLEPLPYMSNITNITDIDFNEPPFVQRKKQLIEKCIVTLNEYKNTENSPVVLKVVSSWLKVYHNKLAKMD
jgi:hypothetical protein